MKDHTPNADTSEWLGVTYRTVLSSEATGGAMSIVDSASPARSGPPRHIHHDADETFIILSGELEIWLDGETFVRGAGDTVFIPRGREHTFRVISDHGSRKYIILTPGGFEGFFHEMGVSRPAIPQGMDAINEAAARFHMTFTGPPLAD